MRLPLFPLLISRVQGPPATRIPSLSRPLDWLARCFQHDSGGLRGFFIPSLVASVLAFPFVFPRFQASFQLLHLLGFVNLRLSLGTGYHRRWHHQGLRLARCDSSVSWRRAIAG